MIRQYRVNGLSMTKMVDEVNLLNNIPNGIWSFILFVLYSIVILAEAPLEPG
jgi:hypothetical protein